MTSRADAVCVTACPPLLKEEHFFHDQVLVELVACVGEIMRRCGRGVAWRLKTCVLVLSSPEFVCLVLKKV